jgi:hypothetical protein
MFFPEIVTQNSILSYRRSPFCGTDKLARCGRTPPIRNRRSWRRATSSFENCVAAGCIRAGSRWAYLADWKSAIRQFGKLRYGDVLAQSELPNDPAHGIVPG